MDNSNKLLIGVLVAIVVVGAGWFIFSGPQNNNNASTDGSQNLNLTNNSDGNEVVAKVNGEEIKSQQITRSKQALGPRGQQVSDRQVLQQLVSQELLGQKAEEEGYSVSKEEAESSLQSQLQQQDMSLEEYKKQLESQGISYESQLPRLRRDLATQNYIDAEVGSQDSEVSDEEAKKFYDQQKQQSPDEMPPYEEIKPQIKQTLKQQKQQQAIRPLLKKLRQDANIEYLKKFETSTGASQG